MKTENRKLDLVLCLNTAGGRTITATLDFHPMGRIERVETGLPKPYDVAGKLVLEVQGSSDLEDLKYIRTKYDVRIGTVDNGEWLTITESEWE